MMMLMNLNYLAILASAVVAMVIGVLWYSPMLFGATWARLLGMRPEAMQHDTMNYVWSFVADLVSAGALAHILKWANIIELKDALCVAFVVWLVVAAAFYCNAAWSRRPLEVAHIDAGYKLVALLAISAVLTLWR